MVWQEQLHSVLSRLDVQSIESFLTSLSWEKILSGLKNGVGVLFTPKAALTFAGLWFGSRIVNSLYNISPFHPLYRFPGPRMAAATYWYEAYYDWIQLGRYGVKIKNIHEQYGPIVRINPDELHCSDPYFTDEIYAGPGRVRDKFQHQLNTAGAGPVSVSGFATVFHEQHRMRRSAVSRFFSRSQMLKLENEVYDFAQLTIDKMLLSAGKEPFEVKEAFNCFTADIISQYAFGEPSGFIAQEGWEPNFATWVKSFLRSSYMLRHNAIARKMTHVMPLLSDYMSDDIKAVTRQMNVVIPGLIEKALNDPVNGRVFREIYENPALPDHEKTLYRLSGEGFAFQLAGTETTGAILTVITFWLLARPEIFKKLMDDLTGLDPSNIKWTELEKRPYLWAIIHEALRMMPGVSHRAARIARNEDLVYKSQDGKTEWVIPRGTPIGMTSMINHWDPELFPDGDDFLPERWLVDGKPDYKLQKFLLSSSKGSRSCIGENLAYCEVYLMTALMAFRVIPRAQLYDTGFEDISYDHDLIVVQTKKGSISVKIEIE